MSFTPYKVEAPRLPVLKPGYFLKVAGKFYEVREVRRYRIKVHLEGGSEGLKDYPLTSDKSDEWAVLHGAIGMDRVVNIQYIACGTADDIKLRWIKDPLMSRSVELPLNSALAPLDSPLEVDKWSYDKEMHLKVTLEAGKTQDLYVEGVEYIVQSTTKRPSEYLELTSDGSARFVKG